MITTFGKLIRTMLHPKMLFTIYHHNLKTIILSFEIFASIIGNNTDTEQFLTICVYTLSPRFRNPKTGIFPAPRPHLPLTPLAPK